MHLRLTLCLIVAESLSLGARAQCQYEVTLIEANTDCDPLPPSPTQGYAINDRAQIVGRYTVCGLGADEAYLWDGGPELMTLQRPPGVGGATAWDINDAGQIVGTMVCTGMGDRAFLHDGVQFNDLGTLPGGNYSRGFAINSLGQIVGAWGNSGIGNPAFAAFIWRDGVMTDLNAQLGTQHSEANDINDTSQVTGWMGVSLVLGGEAFIWQDGSATALGQLPDSYFTTGEAINEAGQVAGWAVTGQFPDTATRAVLWDNGQMIDIGILPGADRRAGVDINDLGQLVGVAWGNPGSAYGGILWQNGVMTDLNDLIPPNSGVVIVSARGINNHGQITGTGAIIGNSVGLLLTPVDVPVGDLDIDCTIGLSDFDMLIEAWGPCPAVGDCPGDLDDDGVVGIVDFLTLLANWG